VSIFFRWHGFCPAICFATRCGSSPSLLFFPQCFFWCCLRGSKAEPQRRLSEGDVLPGGGGLSDREDQKRRVHMGALKWQHRLEESTTARQWHSGNPYLRYKHMSPVAHARPATAGGVGSPCAVSRRCSQRLCSFSAAGQWNALTIEEKAPRSKRAAELQELNLQKAPRAPRLRSGYNVFVRDRFHLFGGGLSRVAAAWRVAAPKVRAIYMRRAAELNASVAALPRRREHCTPRLPTAMHLFVNDDL